LNEGGFASCLPAWRESLEISGFQGKTPINQKQSVRFFADLSVKTGGIDGLSRVFFDEMVQKINQ
jgi:hypothetical protein